MAGVNELVARLQRFAAGEVKARIAAKVRDAVHAECVRGFVEQRDPYGQAWEPRREPTGTWPILQKTGAGIESLTATATADSVKLRINGYFKFHQGGTQYMVARKVFPDANRGLGTWTDPVNRACVEAVRELMK